MMRPCMDGWEGRKEMCMHKSNDYVYIIIIILAYHTLIGAYACTYVICDSDMHHYKFLIIHSIIYGKIV